MAFEEWEFCRFETGIANATKEFIDDAFFQINFFSWIVDNYFTERGSSGNSFKPHFNGTIKPKIHVENFAWPKRTALANAAPDGFGSGTIWFNSRYVVPCRNIYNGNLGNYGWGNRYGALLEVAAVTLHELNHVVNRLEKRAWSMEGYFRFNAQSFVGINNETLCGQTSWPCSANTTNRDGCSLSDLQSHMVDIQDAPDAEARTS